MADDAMSARDANPRSLFRRLRRIVFIAIALLLFLALFTVGACNFAGYHSGTPTTATIDYCPYRGACTATWTLDGEKRTGSLQTGGLGSGPVGGPTYVHVRGDTAYTARASYPAFIGAAVVAAILCASIVAWRRRDMVA
jgi:hypothetical protein